MITQIVHEEPMEIRFCPKCGKGTVMIEYAYPNPKRYDGISEIACMKTAEEGKCHWRIGRWCGKELHGDETENRFCEGQSHE